MPDNSAARKRDWELVLKISSVAVLKPKPEAIVTVNPVVYKEVQNGCSS